MRLLTYLDRGRERIGVLWREKVIDLGRASRHLGVRLPGDMLALLWAGDRALGLAGRVAGKAARLASQGDPAARRALVGLDRVEFRPPVPGPEKIICIGQNYRDHCREQGVKPPKEPVIFSKFVPSLTGHGQPIRLPRISRKVDYEAELAFVIGRAGRHISRRDARAHVAGYMVLNDVSARDLQFGDGQWVRGKSCETFAPCGPCLVTRDEIPNPQRLGIRLDLNGETMQNSSTRNLIFGVEYLVWFLSRAFTLKPGDIVSTGTPPGVGAFRKPPVFLRPGDRVQVSIDRVGTLENPVERE